MVQEIPLSKDSLLVQWVWADELAATADTPQTTMTLMYPKGRLSVSDDTYYRAFERTIVCHQS